jgi:sugar lactone lactonase YvrE
MRARAAAADAGAAAPLPPGVIATFGWGNGAGKLGRNRPDEANPEGPMSLTRDARGNTWVLDQVNGRLVKLDATRKPAGDVPLPVQTPQDVAFTKDGTAAVLDRLVDGAVALVGPDGKQLGELKLVGKGIEAGGAITALVTDGNDVYVEREHGDLVKLGDSKGKPDPDRPEVPGRPTRDGSAFISANIIDAPSGHVAVTSIDRATREHRYTCDVPMGAPILNLNLLDTDRSGVIYLGAVVEKAPAPSGGGDGQYGIFVLCLDPLDGRPLGRAVLPANTDADETFRELTVMDEGGVLFLYRTEQQSQLMRADGR